MSTHEHRQSFDFLIFGTDPLTACRVVGNEDRGRQLILPQVDHPEGCVRTRLLTPRDLQQLFPFSGGNIDHTMLVGGQTYFDRTHSDDPETDFYRFGDLGNTYLCGAGTWGVFSHSSALLNRKRIIGLLPIRSCEMLALRRRV